LVKAFVFGIIISTVSCYCGYHSNKGAKGVGDATTMAVVNSSIMILLSNYFITEIFFSK
jgi:phospholipid/cholesterol/gamma-HCH transport system permease protein